MLNPPPSGFRRFLTALLGGIVVGLIVLGGVQKFFPEHLPRAGQRLSQNAPPDPPSDPLPPEAARYVAAYQNGDWESVIAQTLWMQERLERVRRETGSDQAVAEEQAKLIDELGRRHSSENQLVEEGIEDKYVFSPAAEVAYVGSDSGDSSLEAPVAKRHWLRVHYPQRRTAVLDVQFIPVRALTVGLNLSPEGDILKANVIGNLSIDWESISYDWDQPKE